MQSSSFNCCFLKKYWNRTPAFFYLTHIIWSFCICFLDNLWPHVQSDSLHVALTCALITTGTTTTFRMRQTFAISSFNRWYFSIFLSSLSFTLSSPGMATTIMTTFFSFLSINTMSGFLPWFTDRTEMWYPWRFHFPPLPLSSVYTSC